MATIIEQKPRFQYMPVGQDIIFTISNNSIVTNSNFISVKFIAEVHISNDGVPNLSTNTQVIGTFKTTPNNAAVGMFDFRPVVENYVKADHKALANSTYKTAVNTDLNTPLHLIDKFSGNNNSFRYLAIRFTIQYVDNDSASATFGDLITEPFINSDNYNIINGYLKYTDKLETGTGNDSNDFGYNMGQFEFAYNTTTGGFLTNAPLVQYANIKDYGTVAMLNIAKVFKSPGGSTQPGVRYIVFTFLLEDGSTVNDSIELVDIADGGFPFTQQDRAYNQIAFAGVFPANLRGWSTVFNSNIDNIVSYTFQVQSYITTTAAPASKIYQVIINCPTLKGYEPIRIAWLNQWGGWDYYTFILKSTKKISTKGSTYQQLEGTWNESTYKIDGFRGGKKAFRVNATEKITMNSDYISESESEWFEELINSPEVYILDGFQTDDSNAILNHYVTPVRLTTTDYTKKTVANDKLIQYTFEVEKSKTLRTQSI